MIDARDDRWISFDDFIARAATAATRSKSEIRAFLRERSEAQGVSVGVCVDVPREGRKIVAQGVRGAGAYAEAARGLVDLTELWPLLEDEFGPFREADAKEAPGSSTIGKETRCQRRLSEMMLAAPGCAPMSNADLKEQMKKEFSGLGNRAFTRAKAAAIEETGATAWRSPGRRSNRKS